jgi:class 3 adenylate cyclase
METAILEKLIMKIGALLAVGFGEAGSEIIASNMSQGGDVDPMLPGKKMLAIFGFCDIRNFTDATEVLQQGVMVFVNEIAEIVHGTVDHYNGSANKNIGDAFLLVWKFRTTDYGPDEENPSKLKLFSNKCIQQQADLSVISFLKIITSVSISRKLEKYKGHPGLNERLPNYCVKMGFGLHLGWAIEVAEFLHSGGYRLKLQDRCVVPFAQRQHGVST